MQGPNVVYTCVTGGYDAALMEILPDPQLRWVCFTDRPGKISAPGWEVVPLQSPAILRNGHFINRYHKFFAQRLFPGADWSIYLDGSLEVSGDFATLIDRTRAAKAALGLFMHPHGHNLRKEAEICALSKFDRRDHAAIGEQLERYAGAGVSLDQPIAMGGLMVRDHRSPMLADAMDLWWDQINRYTKRDQVSLPYVLHKTGLPWVALDREEGIRPDWITVRQHAPLSLRTRLTRRLRRLLGA